MVRSSGGSEETAKEASLPLLKFYFFILFLFLFYFYFY